MSFPLLNNFVFLGDVMLGENIFHLGRGIRSLFKEDYTAILNRDVYHFLSNIEYLFFNCEFSLHENIDKIDKIEHKAYLADVSSLSVFPPNPTKIVNIANNHFSQHGLTSCYFTLEYFKKNGFLIVGIDNNPLELKIKDKLIKIWGVSLVEDLQYCNVYFLSSFKNLLNDLIITKKTLNEYWIISLHWGQEFISTPTYTQVDLAHKLIDMGFDLIIGHHPHVLQPVEIYLDKYIFYSLGNFISDQNFSLSTQKGLVIKIVNKRIELFFSFQDKYVLKKIEEVNVKSLCKKNIKQDLYISNITKKIYKILRIIEYLKSIHKSERGVFYFLLLRNLKWIKYQK